MTTKLFKMGFFERLLRKLNIIADAPKWADQTWEEFCKGPLPKVEDKKDNKDEDTECRKEAK